MQKYCKRHTEENLLSRKKEKKRKKAKIVKKTDEIIKRLREKKRDQEKLRRFKIKNDPAAYDEYLKSEKARYKKRKQQGKIQLINKLDTREKRYRRNKNKTSQRRSRQRKRNALISQNNVLSSSLQSKQAIGGKKRAKRNTRKCYILNDALRNENAILNLKIKVLEKKIKRIRIKTTAKKNNDSPIDKVNSFLKNVKATVPAKVKEQLVILI